MVLLDRDLVVEAFLDAAGEKVCGDLIGEEGLAATGDAVLMGAGGLLWDAGKAARGVGLETSSKLESSAAFLASSPSSLSSLS